MAQDIHIAVAVDNGYVQHLAVLLSSLFANTATPERICVHIVGSGVDQDNLSQLRELIEPSNAVMRYYEVDLSVLKDCPTHGHIELATYFRLLLHKILPPEIELCLYLDSDMVAVGDVAELWRIGLEAGQLIGGVQESQRERDLSILGLPDDSEYLNAGVLLINLKEWRAENIEIGFLEFIAKHRDELEWWDQDVINACCQGRKKILSRKWNLTRGPAFQIYLPLLLRRPAAMPKIVHYTSAYKPWKRNDPHPLRGLYWKYLKKTPWMNYRMPPITLAEAWNTFYLRCALIYFNLKRLAFRVKH